MSEAQTLLTAEMQQRLAPYPLHGIVINRMRQRDGGNTMKVGFIGLGKMDFPMATNLLTAGHRVTVYNCTKSRAAELAAQVATMANNPEDCRDSSVGIMMLSDDRAYEELLLSKMARPAARSQTLLRKFSMRARHYLRLEVEFSG